MFLSRPADAPSFDVDAIVAMQLLQPHLVRAMQIRRRLESVELDKRQALEVLDDLESGVLLVDAHGSVLHANRVAADVLAAGDGLRVTHSVLVCAQADDTRALLRLLGASATTAVVEPNPMHAVRRASGKRPLSVLVVPLRGERLGLAAPSATAIVFIADPERATPASAAALRRLYSLTAAEARIALALLEADRLAEVGERLGISISTVRTLLQRVFDKTDTHRQAELVRLLMAHRLPAAQNGHANGSAARGSSRQ